MIPFFTVTYCNNVPSPENNDETDGNTAVVTHGSKTRSYTTNDDGSKSYSAHDDGIQAIKWCGYSNYENSDDNSPIKPFKKSSIQMSRHAKKYDIPMMLENQLKKTYSSSDGGRRKKVMNMSHFGNYGYTGYSTDESSEYESPDEDWYYDPRRTSKWTWNNDYSSITTDNNSESTITDASDFEYLKENNKNGT